MNLKLIFVICALLLNLEWSYGFHILIDPGHGGSDHGAVRGNLIEAQIALDVSQKLIQKLVQTKNISVSQTRYVDKTIPLKDRVKIADEIKPDLFISIHVNSSEDRRAKGAEYYFASTTSKEFESSNSLSIKEKIMNDYLHFNRLYQSKQLAESIVDQNNKNNISRLPRRKILQAPFFVISKTKIPSLLIELGFLTNPEEANDLTSELHQEEISNEIYNGILSYISQNKIL